jgi:hypothetical protein
MLNVIESRPKNARLRMEATRPDGSKSILYNHDHYELLRIALALKATQIVLSDIH